MAQPAFKRFATTLLPKPKPKRGVDREEYWEDVRGWSGLYQISNYGRVLSLDRDVRCGYGGAYRPTGERFLTPHCVQPERPEWRGFHTVYFANDGFKQGFVVHRLVACHFVPNPYHDDACEIEFISGDWRNVHSSNLRWRDALTAGKRMPGLPPRRARVRRYAA